MICHLKLLVWFFWSILLFHASLLSSNIMIKANIWKLMDFYTGLLHFPIESLEGTSFIFWSHRFTSVFVFHKIFMMVVRSWTIKERETASNYDIQVLSGSGQLGMFCFQIISYRGAHHIPGLLEDPAWTLTEATSLKIYMLEKESSFSVLFPHPFSVSL